MKTYQLCQADSSGYSEIHCFSASRYHFFFVNFLILQNILNNPSILRSTVQIDPGYILQYIHYSDKIMAYS